MRPRQLLLGLVFALVGASVTWVAADAGERTELTHRGREPVARPVYRADRVVVNRTRMRLRLADLLEHVDELERLTDRLPGSRTRDRADHIALAMREDLARLERRLDRATQVVEGPPPVEVIYPMADDAFDRLLRSVRAARFDDERLDILSGVVRHSHFTSEQTRRVVRLLTFDRVEAALLLYPRVLDPEEFHIVNSALRFRSDGEELREEIAKIESRRTR